MAWRSAATSASVGVGRPWEEEELWSRPVRRAATHAKGPSAEEKWDDAADNWRNWAEAATGQAAERAAAVAASSLPLSDEELFAVARRFLRRVGGSS